MKNNIIVTASWVNHQTGTNGVTELTNFKPEFKAKNRTNIVNDSQLIDMLCSDTMPADLASIIGAPFLPEGVIINITFANDNTQKFATYLYIIHSNFMGSFDVHYVGSHKGSWY